MDATDEVILAAACVSRTARRPRETIAPFERAMTRTTGTYERSTVAGESVEAFIPCPLPPGEPPLDLGGDLAVLLARGNEGIRLLELAGDLVSSVEWFVYMFVGKEAVLSAQIEGTQATLMDLTLADAATRLEEAGIAARSRVRSLSRCKRGARLAQQGPHRCLPRRDDPRSPHSAARRVLARTQHEVARDASSRRESVRVVGRSDERGRHERADASDLAQAPRFASRELRDLRVERLELPAQCVEHCKLSADRRLLGNRRGDRDPEPELPGGGSPRTTPVGPIERRGGVEAADIEVLPLRMPAAEVAVLDEAWRRLGFESRTAMLEKAIADLLAAGRGT